MNLTKFLSCALCLPCLAGSIGEDNSGGPTQQRSAQTQLPHRTREPERSEELHLGEDSSESTGDNRMECIVITHIRATEVTIRLRRIPVGFYVTVMSENENVTKRTLNRPVSVGKDVVEWDDEIVFPADQLSRISLRVVASFELGPTLGDGEVLRVFETTVSELVDHNGQLDPLKILEQSDGEVISSPASLEIEIERRFCDRTKYAAASNPPESEQTRRLEELTDSGHRALARYRELEEQQDLDESIRRFEQARDLCPPDLPSRATVLSNLAAAKLIYCRVNDASPDLDMAIDLYRVVLDLYPRGHPDHPFTLLSLGIALEARFQRQDNEVDREEGRTLLSQVMDVALLDSYTYHAAVLALGSTAEPDLIRQTEGSKRTKDDLEHDGKVQRLDGALQWIFYPDSSRPALLDHLGILFCVRLECLGDFPGRGEEIPMMELVVQSACDSHPDKHSWLGNLAYSLFTRYEHSRDVVDLEKTIWMFEDAVRFTPDDHPDKVLRLNNLTCSLSQRYMRFGELVDLEKAISVREHLVKLTPDGHPDKPLLLSNLANMLSTRYKRLGDVADLGRSNSIFEDVVRSTPDGHPDKPSSLGNLASSLSQRYMRFGNVVDLQKSISLREELVKFSPDGHPDKLLWFNNLAHSLLQRYMYFGDLVDLQKSTSLREDLVKMTPDGHPDKLLWLHNLGSSLLLRFRRFGDPIDLEKSISLQEDVVKFTPDGHPDKPLRLSNLGDSFSTRYERLGDAMDLEKSISLFGDAVHLTPDDQLDKLIRLTNLAYSLSQRYMRFGDLVDLEKSTSIREVVVKSTPDDHPYKPLYLTSLARSLLERSRSSGEFANSDLVRAVSHSSHAARSHTGSSADRFRASQTWIHCLRLQGRNSSSLLDAYTVAVHLLPLLPWIGLSLHDRYHQLLQAADAVCDAVAAALEVHRPALAVEWLEQGRSVMWSQFSQLRTPVDDIRTAYPELAAQFERVSHELEHASARNKVAVNEVTNHSNRMGGSLEKEAQQHHALALERETLLAEIRALPGFERFLLPKTIYQLSSLAHSGPVVYLNASKYRCDALVVKAGSDHVIHVPLPTTSYDELEGMQLRLKKLLKLNGRIISRDTSDRGARLHRMGPDDVFGSILPYLWENVVSPILDVLGFSMSGPKLPRIFWCPTGPFTFLPIHAAGIYNTTNRGPNVSDFVISSYIPTMSALKLPSHEDTEMTTRNIRLLTVRQPSTDGQAYLDGVPMEMEVIKEVTSSSPFVGLQEADETVEDVLAKMTETDWVHFACHGTQDRTDPFDSGLLLAHGKRLKLSDIAQLSRPQGGLAFLSACQTATGDEQLSEEAIHIAAGMLLAGYRGAIATMWTIMDNDAPRVTQDVYKRLFQNGKVPNSGEAAEALHHAIKRLRESGVSSLSWVPFIHVGV